MKRLTLIFTALLVLAIQAMAQYPPRRDDHFWRRQVINRIDLNEKINYPLIQREGQFYTDNSQYTEKEGIIMALFNGLKQGKFLAYHPDSLNRPLSYEEIKRRAMELSGENAGGGSAAPAGGGEGFDAEGGGEDFSDFGGDEFDGGGGDEFGDSEFTDDLGEGGGGAAPGAAPGKGGSSIDFDVAPFEQVLEFIEDRIFDKTRSDMVYDIQYIRIEWIDPGETLPEKPLCVFKYEDVMETLANTQWKNRFNDAEYRSLKEVFELRMFNSWVLEISGDQGHSKTLEEANYRREQMVNFEHNLWSY